ncbi:cupin domain-containing protein [Henriciella aquimarina]|uniref:cupin domain-containing protein n=1 Tax=Henriciella aquimarina TaxID=545261 RepID=UPI001301E8B9|nr:cupin domain-containing protein [Henriciella aquimarina]
MLDHAAGRLAPGMHLAAEIHRLMSTSGEEVATLWETVRDVLMDKGRHVQPSAHLNDGHIAAAIDIIHTDYSEVKWRRGLSGVRYAKCEGADGQLMRLNPGQTVLSHGHSALEATVVLEGVLDDGRGTYQQGDILLAEAGMKHRPAANGARACVCFVARSPRPFWRFT